MRKHCPLEFRRRVVPEPALDEEDGDSLLN